jgi:hypothetical protein
MYSSSAFIHAVQPSAMIGKADMNNVPEVLQYILCDVAVVLNNESIALVPAVMKLLRMSSNEQF